MEVLAVPLHHKVAEIRNEKPEGKQGEKSRGKLEERPEENPEESLGEKQKNLEEEDFIKSFYYL